MKLKRVWLDRQTAQRIKRLESALRKAMRACARHDCDPCLDAIEADHKALGERVAKEFAKLPPVSVEEGRV